jgi:MFS family permease
VYAPATSFTQGFPNNIQMLTTLIVLCYFLQYTDKILINYANIMGLQKDTGISGDQFSQLALLFYVTYLAFEFPTGYLMQRLPTAKYLGANVMLWGLMIACTSAAHDWGGLASLRVLLGCFESAVAPALIIITTMWYKKTEQPSRLGFWYVGTAIGKMVGAITSFGFQHYEGSTFKSWQIMFLVFGVVTIAVGITVVLVMPDNPMSSRLSQKEKAWAIERLRSNRTGIENKSFKRHQVFECFRDPQTWLLGLLVILSNIPNGFVSSFQATVIKSFGFTSEVTSLLSTPTGFIDAICTLGATWLASKYNMRSPLIISIFAASCLGSCLLAFLPEDGYVGGKMFGSYAASLIGSSLPLMYSFAGANFAGHTKKITMNAILLMSFCEYAPY